MINININQKFLIIVKRKAEFKNNFSFQKRFVANY